MSSSIKSIFLLTLAWQFALGAEADWRLIPNASPEGQAWIDVSGAKFDGSTVIATYKWEYQGGTGFYLVSANCANTTITQLGGEFHKKAGVSIPKDSSDKKPGATYEPMFPEEAAPILKDPLSAPQSPSDKKPMPAPSGTFAGTLHRFMCDLRPVWRRWIQ